MKRLGVEARPDWEKRLENELEFSYHSLVEHQTGEHVPYWNETAFYEFSKREIDELYTAGKACWDAYVAMTGDLIDKNKLDLVGIADPKTQDLIRSSWNQDRKSMIGRFDFSYNGVSPPKMLEFNGDTPTSLLEAAIIQWDAKETRYGDRKNYDQFNTIHENMIESWKYMKDRMGMDSCHFTSDPNFEDMSNAVYAMKLAQQAGISTQYLATDEIGYDPARAEMYGLNNEPISALYKLWPWEYMLEESPDIIHATYEKTTIIEPLWKMVMSTKAALPVLHAYNPNSPYILKAYFNEDDAKKHLCGSYVKKPFLSREGAGVTLIENGREICREEDTKPSSPHIFQEMAKLPEFYDDRDLEKYHPVIGIWVIGGDICGMGIRESHGPITNNGSFFTPHYFIK